MEVTQAKNMSDAKKNAAGAEAESGGAIIKVGATSQVATDSAARLPSASTKKPLGAKEVIPFKWKLIGISGGMALTLFKSVEREDVDAQYERVRKEGHYADLRILDIDAKVAHPNPPKVRKERVRNVKKVVETKKPAARIVVTLKARAKAKPEAMAAAKAKPKAKAAAEAKPARKTAKSVARSRTKVASKATAKTGSKTTKKKKPSPKKKAAAKKTTRRVAKKKKK